MGILDGFLFWLGRMLAEFLVVVVLILCLGILMLWPESK
jgi:hypothetical protein